MLAETNLDCVRRVNKFQKQSYVLINYLARIALKISMSAIRTEQNNSIERRTIFQDKKTHPGLEPVILLLEPEFFCL